MLESVLSVRQAPGAAGARSAVSTAFEVALKGFSVPGQQKPRANTGITLSENPMKHRPHRSHKRTF